MAGTIAPDFLQQFFDANVPAAGYKVFAYASGTTTKQNTYTDSTLGTPNTNPIVLDSAGRASIFLDTSLTYKFVFTTPTDTDPPASPIKTVDGVVPSQLPEGPNVDISGTSGDNISAGYPVYLADSIYALNAGRTAGRWYPTTATYAYSSSLPHLVGFALNNASAGEAVTVRTVGRVTGLTGVVVGEPNYCASTLAGYGARPTNGYLRVLGFGDSATSMILPPSPYFIAPHTYVVSANSANSSTTETDLNKYSYLLSYGELAYNADTMAIKVCGTLAANTNVKTLKLYVGAVSTTLISSNANVANNRFTCNLNVTRLAADTVRVTGDVCFDGATGAAGTRYQIYANITGIDLDAVAGNTVKLTGQGGASSDLIATWGYFSVQANNTQIQG